MTKDKWIWMPHAAHFICGNWCRFKLATYVGKYIVSTVGEYWPDEGVRRIHAQVHDPVWLAAHQRFKGDYWDHEYMKRFGYENIGHDRKYETMVFKAKKSRGHGEDYKCCPYEIIVQDSLDFAAYNTATDAYKGHLALCKKWGKT